MAARRERQGVQRSKQASARVFVSGGFPAGCDVGLYRRRGDSFSPALPLVAETKVSERSTAEFRNLDEGDQFWVAGEVEGQWRARSAVAKEAPVGKAKQGFDNLDSESLRFQREDYEVVTGARNSVNTRMRDDRGHRLPQQPLAHEQEARLVPPEKGAVLASDTHAGSAVPVPVGPLQQEDVPDGVVQASDTEAGTASPLAGELSKVKGDDRAKAAVAMADSRQLDRGQLERLGFDVGKLTPEEWDEVAKGEAWAREQLDADEPKTEEPKAKPRAAAKKKK